MRNIKKRLAVLVIVIVLVMSFTGTAFATGQNLSHSGTSTYGYYTNDYVSQRYDNTLTCTYGYESNDGMRVYPVMYDSGWVQINDWIHLGTGHWFGISDWTYVRRIHLQLVNAGDAYNTSTYTNGTWLLTA